MPWATHKKVFTKHMGDMVQLFVSLTIGNLSHEIRRSWSRPGKMIVSLIPIIKKDYLEIKIEIYHQTIGMITKDMFKSLLSCIVI